MLNAFVCVFKRTLAGNNDFRIIILYLQEIAKFPFYSFRFGEFEGDLHIQPFAASRTDKIYFLRSQGSDFYVVTAEEQVVADHIFQTFGTVLWLVTGNGIPDAQVFKKILFSSFK